MRAVISVLFLLILAPAAAAEPSPMETSFAGNPLVIINITYDPGPGGGDGFEGEIVLELFLNWAPITVSNFLGLVNQSFYEGIFYHRIIDDFVIQSGDPTCRATQVRLGESVSDTIRLTFHTYPYAFTWCRVRASARCPSREGRHARHQLG